MAFERPHQLFLGLCTDLCQAKHQRPMLLSLNEVMGAGVWRSAQALVGLSVFPIRGPGLRLQLPGSSFLWCALGEAVVAQSTGFLSLSWDS